MRKNGSVTVFFVLLLVLLASVLFAFLEAARVSCLKAEAHLCTGQAADAVRASYQPELWKDYHLLFWQQSGTDVDRFADLYQLQKDMVEKNQAVNVSHNNFFFLPVHSRAITVEQYQLATDSGGLAFRKQAADWVKKTIAGDSIDLIWKVVTNAETEQLEQSGIRQEQEVEDVLEQYGSKSEASGTLPGEQNPPEAELPSQPELSGLQEDPLIWMKKVQKKGILDLVMDGNKISEKETDWSEAVDSRQLQSGNWTEQASSGSVERMLFHLYCQGHFFNVTRNGNEKKLNYEMEYLIGGKTSDVANLKVVVRRLLLIREGINLAYLETDVQKSQEALTLALGITSAVGNPELAEPVKHAILAAWAYAQKQYDGDEAQMRILLDGGHVSLRKTEAQWRTSLEHVGDCLNASADETSREGLGYESYLQILLWTVSEEKITMRAMNLIEKNLDVRMDSMVSRMTCSYEYEAVPLFWSFVQIGNGRLTSYYFSNQAQILFGL